MTKLVRGFRDILPADSGLFAHIEDTARELFHAFGFSEIRTPILEQTELFARSIGADTDIVEKEMYTFEDRNGQKLTLRPEATAGVVRAYIEHGFHASEPIQRLFSVGPMFRRERPQKGRFRQFTQINAEVFGLSSYLADAQLIYLLVKFFQRLAVTGLTARVNSLGCPECRPAYKARLVEYFQDKKDHLCENCTRRLSTNPLRVLDCKAAACKKAAAQAPAVREFLCDACRRHFFGLTENLDRLGVAYEPDDTLVRGLDYYTRTVFEIQAAGLGAQNAVAGGGRYDGLVEALGGRPTPAVGFAIGGDRLLEIVDRAQAPDRSPDIFFAWHGEALKDRVFTWTCELCEKGVAAVMEYEPKSIKAQMKRANKSQARWVLVVGEDEWNKGEAVMRALSSDQERTITLSGVVSEIAAFFRA